jgi:hydrogenase nickel incorporation protein HypA/HybF
MHEMAICESIVQCLEEQAAQHNYARVKTVWLEIGPLAGVELEALHFSFDAVTRGTLAERAALKIIETKAQAWCMPCAKTVEVAQRFDPCPDCGSYQLQLTCGGELRIKELEVD